MAGTDVSQLGLPNPNVGPSASPVAHESMGPRLAISASEKNPSPVEPLPPVYSQGHVMTSAQPFLEFGHNPAGPAFQRPLEELG